MEPVVAPALLEQIAIYLAYVIGMMSIPVFGIIQMAKPIFLDWLQSKIDGNLYLSLLFIARALMGVAIVAAGGLEPLYETVPFLLVLPWTLVVLGTGVAVGVDSSALYAVKEFVDWLVSKSEPEPLG